MVRLLTAGSVLLGLACAGLGEEAATEAADADPLGEPPRAEVGQCLLDDVVVDCNQPHTDEVFHTFAPPSPRPDEEALSALASDTCEDAFEAYVGEPAPMSGYSVGWVLPRAHGEVTCLLFGPTTRTQSARGQSQRP